MRTFPVPPFFSLKKKTSSFVAPNSLQLISISILNLIFQNPVTIFVLSISAYFPKITEYSLQNFCMYLQPKKLKQKQKEE